MKVKSSVLTLNDSSYQSCSLEKLSLLERTMKLTVCPTPNWVEILLLADTQKTVSPWEILKTLHINLYENTTWISLLKINDNLILYDETEIFSFNLWFRLLKL